MSHRIVPLLAAALLLLAGCSSQGESEGASVLAKTEGCKGPDGGLVLLCSLLEGEYHLSDANGSDITTRFVKIWPETKEGCWIYEEMRDGSGLPPFQRVHRLTGKDGQYRSVIHEIPDAQRFLGAAAEDFDALRPEELLAVEGCGFPLTRAEEFLFEGELPRASCLAPLPELEGGPLEFRLDSHGIRYLAPREGDETVELVLAKGEA